MACLEEVAILFSADGGGELAAPHEVAAVKARRRLILLLLKPGSINVW